MLPQAVNHRPKQRRERVLRLERHSARGTPPCEDLGVYGFIVKSYALTDSSAAKSISQREGVGNVRHSDTRALWLHAEVKIGRLTMLKVSTEDNLADIGAKGHD